MARLLEISLPTAGVFRGFYLWNLINIMGGAEQTRAGLPTA
jgi:hypothetical protein